MQRSDFESFFKKRLAKMGLDPTNFGLHGFRHGGLQETMLVEENMGLVAITSDHTSNAILAYSMVPPERRMRISAKVSRNLSYRTQ